MATATAATAPIELKRFICVIHDINYYLYNRRTQYSCPPPPPPTPPPSPPPMDI